MKVDEIQQRVADYIEANQLVKQGEKITALVSGGPDSSCLYHILVELGYDVQAVHVNHHLRGSDSDEDATYCAEVFKAFVVDAVTKNPTESQLRDIRYSSTEGSLRATGHTASDQVETVLQRLVSSGTTRGIPLQRDDGVIHPLLCLWREETLDYCSQVGLDIRNDESNGATKRGLLRRDILPLLRQIHPSADENILRSIEPDERLPRPIERGVTELLKCRKGSKRLDLGSGLTAVREYDYLWLERSPVRLQQPVEWSGWSIEPKRMGLIVRGWRPGDRLGKDGTKLQDLFIEAKVPVSEREAWPLVVHHDQVVFVPGIGCEPGYEGAVIAVRKSGENL